MPKETFFNLSNQKRGRILEAAIREFATAPYQNVTIDKIVNRAQIPKGSFYQYFLNKDDIYMHIFSQVGDVKKSILESLSDQVTDLSFVEFITEAYQLVEDYEKKSTELIKLKNRFINECSQELKKEILKNEFPKSTRFMEKILKMYIVKGEIDPAIDIGLTAYMLSACITNLDKYLILDDYQEFFCHIQLLIKKMLSTLVQGIKKTETE